MARARGRFGHAEVFAAIAAASFAAARFLPLLALPYTCPLKRLAALPCATCGMTHAFVHLAHGDVALAFAASPLGAVLAAAAWVYALADLGRVVAGLPLPAVPPRLLRGTAAAGVLALLVNWAYLVVREVT